MKGLENVAVIEFGGNVNIQGVIVTANTAAQAIVERDRGKALRALLVNPLIRTYDRAVGTLERAWDQTTGSAGSSGGVAVGSETGGAGGAVGAAGAAGAAGR